MFSIATKGPASVSKASVETSKARSAWRSHTLSLLPLLICLCIALLIRIYLIIHTHGAIAADESETGIQAEHILRGEWPVYYYGQPYMGSLEAYILALMFALAGPSVFTLRLATSLVSLGLVVLTWAFASALANEAGLSLWAKRCFMYIATLFAALPPLYDAVLELRSLGGYVEAMVIMLWLLYSAFRLTPRWRDGASTLELSLRWLGIGFLFGLGMWTDPLITYAVAAIALWLSWFILARAIKLVHDGDGSARLTFVRELLLLFAMLPGCIVGAAPALYWGYYNKWSNVAYIFHSGGGTFNRQRIETINQVQSLYTRCIAPRVIGGALPTEPYVTQNHPQILTAGFVINIICLAIAVGAIALSLFWHRPLLARLRKLTLLPLVFLACTSVVYCMSSIAVASIYAGCGPWDLTGRYVVPLVVGLPFVLAAVVTLLWFPKDETNGQDEQRDRKGLPYTSGTSENVGGTLAVSLRFNPIQERILRSILLVAILLVYFGTQGYAYLKSSSHNTFQTSGCIAAPADATPIITYMEQQHIRYALATSWVGDPLTFKTDGKLLVTQEKNRVQSMSDAVLHSDRYSLLFLVDHTGPEPLILQKMDARHITYRTQRFETIPGKDLIVITPLNQTVSPLDPYFRDAFQQIHDGC
jgi:hypothetical protein